MGLPKAVESQQKIVESFDKHIREVQEPASEIVDKKIEESSEQKVVGKVDDVAKHNPDDPRHDTVEYWQNRCNVVLGKYNAESRRLNSEIQSLKAQIEKMGATTSINNETLISDEDREEYGEYANLVESTAKKQQAQNDLALANQQREIDGLKAQKVEDVETTFYTNLSAQVPDWQAINGSKGFNDWLDTIDPRSGNDYRSLLQNAEKVMDVDRVIYFFKSFGESGKHTTSSSKKTVMPETRQGGANNQTGDGFITRSEIGKFYDDINRGKYRGKQKEIDAMENKISQALKNNRVINR